MPGNCPPEATQSWWNGSWATREMDSTGEKLTAFTTLLSNGKYKTTLAFDKGKKLQHWGRCQIHVTQDLSASFREDVVSDQSIEAAAIGEGVQLSIDSGSFNFGGALPSSVPPSSTQKMVCLHGDIEYFVDNSEPKIYYTSPQKYSFITQGKGYVRVSGPGANNVLARRY